MDGEPGIQIVTIDQEHREWVQETLDWAWGSSVVVNRGQMKDASKAPGYIAFDKGEPVGLATYLVCEDECELLTLNSLRAGRGIGALLVSTVRRAAMAAGCRRLWVVTTNDNTPALRFYQRKGFVLAALRPNAVTAARRIKPEIPETGLDGIPLRDEIELEMWLDSGESVGSRSAK